MGKVRQTHFNQDYFTCESCKQTASQLFHDDEAEWTGKIWKAMWVCKVCLDKCKLSGTNPKPEKQ